jgi:hypothetical protein
VRRDAEETRIHDAYRAVDGIRRDRDRGRSGSMLVGSPACADLEQTAAPQQIQIPDAAKVPSGNKLAGSFEGRGVQIYQCTNNSWTLLQVLLDRP